MLRIIMVNKVNGMLTLEMSEDSFRKIMKLVDDMAVTKERALLENIQSDDKIRQNLQDLKELKEDFRKAWETVIQ
jgi:hypothetical protein